MSAALEPTVAAAEKAIIVRRSSSFSCLACMLFQFGSGQIAQLQAMNIEQIRKRVIFRETELDA
ncbi:MAG: hypothetical protein B7Z55_14700 [Planctomycetales bacterium 12-60-4]|nr:MAG: hypothetical protein B7Z55_14700 [Planctomycetales bacterium 12-60-4]